MTIPTYEIGTGSPRRFGALDAAAFSASTPLSAHVLRELARGSNYLLARGEPLVEACFTSTASDALLTGRLSRRVQPFTSLPPLLVPKRACLRSATIDVFAKVTTGFTARLWLGTLGQPFNPASPSFALVGDGTAKRYGTLGPVRLAENLDYEVLTAYVSVPAGAPINPAIYGGVYSGLVDGQSTSNHIVSADVPWNVAGNTIGDGDVVAALSRGTGGADPGSGVNGAAIVTEWQLVTTNGAQFFTVFPDFASGPDRLLTPDPGEYVFWLFTRGDCSIESLTVWADDL